MSTLVAAGGAAAFAAVACGLAGVLVPSLIARLPEPEPTDEPKRPYAEIAARRGLARVTAGVAAVSGGVVGGVLGWSWPLLFWLPLVPVGVLLGYVDLRTKLLPSVVVRPATLLVVALGGVSAALSGDGDALVRGLVGLVVVRSVFWVLWWIRSAGMGFGDVRLSALLGFALAYLGWAEVLLGTYASFLVFGLPGLLVALVRRDRSMMRTAYPFGPAMLAGAVIGVVLAPLLGGHLGDWGA
ncbi:prepilin peptidase [Nocardioides sp. MAHUQ-72]|uniref:prepilin peptidase n=1 Tax=unclassified Nocardioides TaxID=2615069 RepID=UPI00360F7A62